MNALQKREIGNGFHVHEPILNPNSPLASQSAFLGPLLSLAALLFLAGNDRVALFDRDEPWYAEISREMVTGPVVTGSYRASTGWYSWESRCLPFGVLLLRSRGCGTRHLPPQTSICRGFAHQVASNGGWDSQSRRYATSDLVRLHTLYERTDNRLDQDVPYRRHLVAIRHHRANGAVRDLSESRRELRR